MSVKKSISSIFTGGLKITLPLLALFVGISSYLTLKSNRPNPPKPQKREAVQPIRTQAIKLSSHQPVLKLYGEVKPGRQLELRALVAGKVMKTGERFLEGSLVQKGDVLLSIDSFSYAGAVVEANANIVEARARLKENSVQIKSEETSIKYALEQLKLAKTDMERAQKLMRKGSVTRQGGDQRALIVSQRRQTLDNKRANLDILRAKAEQQNANIKSLEWRLQQAKRNRSDTELKAPFSGYINEVNANVGKLLNVNDRVAVLLDSDWMEVVFTLSDRQYGRLAQGKGRLIGRAIKVTWVLGATRLAYQAVVERIGAQISAESGGVAVYARLKNPSRPRPIRAGAFVDIEVPDRVYDEVARLPQTALYGRSKIYVVGPDKRLVERLIKLHAIDGEFVLVSGDLRDGERVVKTRMSVIGGGMKVRDLDLPQKIRKKPDPSGALSDAKTRSDNPRKPAAGGALKQGPSSTERKNRG